MKKIYSFLLLVTMISSSLWAANPVVSSVSSGSSTPAKIGDVLTITVTFDQAVTIAGGTPTLLLETGTSDQTASYTGDGTLSTTHNFNYTVQAGDESTDIFNFSVPATALSSNGATIENDFSEVANLDLTAATTPNVIIVDGIRPQINIVTTATANGSYKNGDANILITITFDEAVTVAGGIPTLTLRDAGADPYADYTSGSPGTTLTFTYVIDATANTGDLDYTTSNALVLNGATILDGAGNNALITLPSPGTEGSLGLNKAIILDNIAPYVVNVTSNTNNGSYKTGDADIVITVEFNENIALSGGSPTLTLNETGSTPTANYTDNVDNTLTFTYNIEADATASDLDYAATSSLDLNGENLTDAAGNSIAIVALPTPGNAGSLAFNKNISLDNTAPTINAIGTISVADTYIIGDDIYLTVAFNESVIVNSSLGRPKLQLNSHATDAFAIYSSGSGNDSLTFRYRVQEGEVAADLRHVDDQFDLNGGTISDAAGNIMTVFTTPAPAAMSLVVDGLRPQITGVTATAGTYKINDVIPITVTFDDDVTISGIENPSLQLETGSTDQNAICTVKSTNTAHIFNYTVQAGDTAIDLNYRLINSLYSNGALLLDNNGNEASLKLLPLDNAASLAGGVSDANDIKIDGIAPYVLNVTSTNSNGYYTNTDVIEIAVVLNEFITIGGTNNATLIMDLAGDPTATTMTSSNDTLFFNYTVGASDETDDLDYKSIAALVLGTTTLTDENGNVISTISLPAPEGTGSLGRNKNIAIDNSAPIINEISTTNASGTYIGGNIIYITVAFNEPVVVNTALGRPKLRLNNILPAVPVYPDDYAFADFYAGSGTDVLRFRYRIQEGDTVDVLNFLQDSLLTNGGIITNLAGIEVTKGVNGKAYVTTNPATDNLDKTLAIDGISPRVVSVDASAFDGTKKVGDVVAIDVIFDQKVKVIYSGIKKPYLWLETGRTDRTIDCQSADLAESYKHTFQYTVQAGDTTPDLNYKRTSSLISNGAKFMDLSGNIGSVALPAIDDATYSLAATSAIVVDGVAPYIVNVNSSTSNGRYTEGDIISIQVEFHEAVTVTGTPTLDLSGAGVVNYESISANGKILTFNYTVLAGDNTDDLDYASTNALTAGTSIKDAAENNASLILPEPGTTGSLGKNQRILLDNTAPTITSIASTFKDGETAKIRERIYINVVFTEPVIVTTTATDVPYLLIEMDTETDTAFYQRGNGRNTLTFIYLVKEGDLETTAITYGVDALETPGFSSIKDEVNKLAVLTNPVVNSLVLQAIKIDGVKPTVDDIAGEAGPYQLGDVKEITLTFSEPVSIRGVARLLLETGDRDRYAYHTGDGIPGLTKVFTYTVQEGDYNLILDYKTTRSLISGTIQDEAGNYLDRDLPVIGGGSSLAQNSILVDALAPTVTNVTSTDIDGYYVENDVITITIDFSESVTVTGASNITLELETGIVDQEATCITSDGALTTLEFEYTVQSDDFSIDLAYTNIEALQLNGATIVDANANTADLTLPDLKRRGSLSYNKTLKVDAQTATISNVTSTNANGTYGVGKNIYIKVYFDEKVVVNGNPYLVLQTGNSSQAIYNGGSGSNTLTFKYNVQTSDASADLEYENTGSLVAGGNITDLAGNLVDYTLPTIGSGYSLSDNKDIEITGSKKSANTAGRNNSSLLMDAFEFNIYPNPVQNIIHIDGNGNTDRITIEMYSILGEKIYMNTTELHGVETIEHNFKPGMYILRISNNLDTFTKQLVIE